LQKHFVKKNKTSIFAPTELNAYVFCPVGTDRQTTKKSDSTIPNHLQR